MQLFKVLFKLYKGERDEIKEIAGKFANCFSSAMRLRKGMSIGAKIAPSMLNIIAVFIGQVDSQESSSTSVEPIMDSSPSPASSARAAPRGASSSGSGHAEELLRMARERSQASSPPRRAMRKVPSRVDIEDSPTTITDSPVQANTDRDYAQHRVS